MRRWLNRNRTYPLMASAFITNPAFAGGTQTARTGIERWKTERSRESFIHRASGGAISSVTFRGISRTALVSDIDRAEAAR